MAVADTHTFETDIGSVPAGDVFVHAGDLCRAGSLNELEAPAAWIRGLPHLHKIVIAGNHDWCFVHHPGQARKLLGDTVTFLQDSGVTIEGVRFWGSAWQPEFCGWAFNLPRGPALAERWSLIPNDTDVLITHGPPAGFGDNTTVEHRQGCEDLLRELDRVSPRIHLFGHIHEDGGLWENGEVTLLNVNTWEGQRAPTVIDLDVVTGTVTPLTVPPRDPW
ncbi:metallophosphatase domain-containing protein [Myxococcota bacterium]